MFINGYVVDGMLQSYIPVVCRSTGDQKFALMGCTDAVVNQVKTVKRAEPSTPYQSLMTLRIPGTATLSPSVKVHN